MQSFFMCHCNLPSPQISCSRKLHCLSSNNSENTNHRHLLITVIVGFLRIFTFRETITHFRTISFSQSPGSNFQVQFWMDCVFPLMPIISSCKSMFICVDCCTGRLISSNIILHKRTIRWILFTSQAEMRTAKCVSEAVAHQWNLIVINYWREILQCIQEFGPQIKPSSTILGPNNKRVQGFHPCTPHRELRVNGWLDRWIHISPTFDF